MLADGTYKAKPREIILSTSSKNTPKVSIRFELYQEGAGFKYADLYYSEKAKNYTLDALEVCGLLEIFSSMTWQEGSNQKLVEGNDVDLILETGDFEGKSFQKVKYINRLGGAQFVARKPEVWKGMDLKNDVKAYQMEKGAAPTKKKQGSDFAPNEDIPF